MAAFDGFQTDNARMIEDALRLDDMQCMSEIRILVIDDDAATCQVVAAALENRDFHIRIVSDPAEVETALKGEQAYDLVILDYVLPGLEPEQVLGWVLQHQAGAGIIVITGYPSMESALNCLRARTFDYLTKPFQIAHLRQTVLRCLQAKGRVRMTEEVLCTTLGNIIRERRKAIDLTLSALAERAGVSVGHLSQIELGKSAASIEKIYRISIALGVRLSDLFEPLQR